MTETATASLIVKSRIKEIAKAEGKILSTSFLNFLDRQARETVKQACHMIGSRKIVKAGEYEQYRKLLKSYGGQ